MVQVRSAATWLELLTVSGLALQAIASIFVVGTFFVYFRQLKAMQAQLAQNQQSSSEQVDNERRVMHAQTTTTLAAFLHSPQVYEARRHLLSYLASIPYNQWTDDDKTKARHAIGAYDIAAILARMDAVPLEVVARNWGASVIKCEAAGHEMILALRVEHGTPWWDDFLRLVTASRLLWPAVTPQQHRQTGA
jgi:hypothetical protein